MSESRPIGSVSVPRSRAGRWRLSVREVLGLVTIAALLAGHVVLLRRLTEAQRQLAELRTEAGYLPPTAAGQVAACRAPSDQPLTYRVRVRVPSDRPYRVAYSSVFPKDDSSPRWYAAADLPPGDSLVTVRVARDPRDERWKISTLVQAERGNKRVATTLPDGHVSLFRGNHEVVSAGVGRTAVTGRPGESIRLIDERWLAGNGALMLFGDRPPDRDQIGVYAELQPDSRPL